MPKKNLKKPTPNYCEAVTTTHFFSLSPNTIKEKLTEKMFSSFTAMYAILK